MFGNGNMRISGAVCLFVCALMVLSANSSAAYSWTIKEIPDTNGLIDSNGMALDSSGNPGIGYTVTSDRPGVNVKVDLKFARYDGSSWDIDTVSSGWSIISVAYNKDGNPTMAFASGGLKLATHNPSTDTWTIEKPDKKAGMYSPSLAYDANGLPYISYANGGLMLAQKSSSGVWSTQMIDKGVSAITTSLAFDNSGRNPAIAYSIDSDSDARPDTVKWARYDGANKKWNTETIEVVSSTAAGHCKIAYSNDGNPTILYIRKIDGNYHYGIIHWDSAGGKWGGFDTFCTATESAQGKSLTYSGSTPYVAFCPGSPYKVKIAHKTDSGWATEDVGSVAGGSYCVNLKLDSSGSPKLTYNDNDNYHLYYAAGA